MDVLPPIPRERQPHKWSAPLVDDGPLPGDAQPDLESVGCRVCGCSPCRDRGAIHVSWQALHGRPPAASGRNSRLLVCPSCGFQFRHPAIISEQEPQDYYTAASFAQWGDARRRRFDLLERIVARHAPGRRILDVGCSTGELLRAFGPSWQKFGVEPSERAAELARGAGVTILAGFLSQLSPDAGLFDAVTLIDVAEHVVDPVDLFRQIRRRLRPGGVCLTVTLDTTSFAWRLEGPLHWYCALPEHVSFFSRDSMNQIERQVGLEVVEHRRVMHAGIPLRQILSQAVRNTAFMGLVRCRGLGVPRLKRRVSGRAAPGWGGTRDHMVRVSRAV